MRGTRSLKVCLMAAILSLTPSVWAQQDKVVRQLEPTDPVTHLLDALGPATQATDDKTWRRQHAAESDAAKQLRELIANGRDRDALVAADRDGRTPLIKAALRGYADVVEALLSDAGVRAGVNAADRRGLTAWMAAQFQRPMTLVSCHPQVLEPEYAGLWGRSLQRMAYFNLGQQTAFDRISELLLAAGAQPDPEGAKRQWGLLCPGQEPALARTLAASQNVPNTLMADTVARWQAANDKLMAGQRSDNPGTPVLMTPLKPASAAEEPDSAGQAKTYANAARVCSEVSMPQLPLDISFNGNLTYQVIAEIQDGYIVALEFEKEPARGRLKKSELARFKQAVVQSLTRAVCPGDHLLSQLFDFNFR